MLEEMRIRGLGVIADATVPLAPGLTVLTGETGAGKTMVLAGLGLLFGGRADAHRVRAGSRHALVEGRLRLPAGDPALVRATDAGAEADEDGTLLLSRTVTPEGRTRAHAGGRSVPVGLLAALGADLLAVHGQADQARLRRPGEQRAALDRFGGEPVTALLAEHRTLFEQWQTLSVDLAERTAHSRERQQEAALLQHGLDEIAAVDPQPGEDEQLRAEALRLDQVDALRQAATAARNALAGDELTAEADPDAAALLAAAQHALEPVTGTDPQLADLAGRLAEAAYVLTDVAGELASYTASLDADPARLATVHERRAALSVLTRRYADSIDGVLAWAGQAADRIATLDTSAEALAELTERRDAAAEALAGTARRLTAARRVAAERFGSAVTAELIGLAMPDAVVSAVVAARAPTAGQPMLSVDGAEVGVGPDGADEVTLLLRPHRGADPQPLQRGASGGELSRVMLAVEVVLADDQALPTMIFDEVDAGVGGRAAVEVGRRLARLAGEHQVLVVTHLPQVAAFADTHLVVDKDSDGSITQSGVRPVSGADRQRELARMLAGLDGSDLGMAHARELLDSARSTRAQDRDHPGAPPPVRPAGRRQPSRRARSGGRGSR